MINFQTSPQQYKHWKLSIDDQVATLSMDVQEDQTLADGYKLKLNSYDLGVDIELADAIQRLRFEHPEVSAVVVDTLFTVCDTAPELLPVKFESPIYAAVIECVPTASVLTVIVATLPLTAAVPSVFAPSLNITVPVAFPPNCGVSDAVNVTAWL